MYKKEVTNKYYIISRNDIEQEKKLGEKPIGPLYAKESGLKTIIKIFIVKKAYKIQN